MLKNISLVFIWANLIYGQSLGFGKNKVQYDDFQWKRIETTHFDLFFYPEEEALAAHTAIIVERQFRDLERKFVHTVKRRIPLVIYSSHIYFEQTNIIPNLLPEGVAGFTEYLKGRVALPLSGSIPEYERVLHHELVHVFMFDRIARNLERHGVLEFRPAPLWFSEGLAEYWSSRQSALGNMILRDALFSQRFPSIINIHTINGTFQMYKQGESICKFMAQEFGEDVFERLFVNWWRAETFNEVFFLTTGEPIESFDEKWVFRERKHYFPTISNRDLLSQSAKILTHHGFNIKPAWVQDDEGNLYYVYFKNRQGYTQIARGDENESHEIIIDGERLTSIESLHPLTSKIAVSFDGHLLAFVGKSRGRDHLHIWDIKTKKLFKDLDFDEIVAMSSPAFSPNGTNLVFSGTGKNGFTDLYVVDIQNGSLSPLTQDIYHDREPDWSPDGNFIAFASDRFLHGRRGKYNIFLYDIENKELTRVTKGEFTDQQPDFAPDGRSIIFSSDRDSVFNIHMARFTDGEARVSQLTRFLTGAFDPVWSPEGNEFLFSGYQAGNFQIYKSDLKLPEKSDVQFLVSFADSLPWTLENSEGNRRFAQRPYKGEMELDVAQSQISQDPEFGTSGGLQFLLSDVLGNDQYSFVLSHISGNQSGFADGLNVALTRLHLGQQRNWSWGVFRLNDRFSSKFGRFIREKRIGGYLGVSYPFSRHNRVDSRISLRKAEIDRQFEGRKLDGWLINNFLTYRHDSSLWIPTGPIEGKRYNIGLAQTIDLKTSSRFNFSIYGDYRYYIRLGQRFNWSMRYMARRSFGKVPEYFSLGGSWTLRGYPWRSLWGSKMFLINQELRFPFIDRFHLGLPFGNIDFGQFRGALLLDAGNAWSDSFGYWRGAFGFGTRLALGGAFVFRLDVTRRTDFNSVTSNTNWDFFFGWDF